MQVLCAIAAFAAVVVLPETVHIHHKSYVIALMTLHVVLALPSIWSFFVGDGEMKYSLQGMYYFLAGASLTMHMTTLMTGLKASNFDWLKLLHAGWQNSCQSSISYDVVFTIVVCSLYAYARRGKMACFCLLLLSPIISVGAAFAYFLAMEEDGTGSSVGGRKKSNTTSTAFSIKRKSTAGQTKGSTKKRPTSTKAPRSTSKPARSRKIGRAHV
jgi:hypothetical protein